MMHLPDLISLSEQQAEFLGRIIEAELLPGAGSDRSYWRLTFANKAQPTALCMRYSLQRAENRSFATLSRWLTEQGVRVPQIYAEHVEEGTGRGWLWIEDLGNEDLLEMVTSGSSSVVEVYTKAALAVLQLHQLDVAALPDAIQSCLQEEFDVALYRWEQDYFWTYVAEQFQLGSAEEIAQARTNPALAELAASLGNSNEKVLVHRDFQSTNILLLEGKEVALIDYQGMRLGNPEYDLASLLYDPYVELGAEVIDAVLLEYAKAIGEEFSVLQQRVKQAGVQRLMQAMGAYGKLGVVEKKTRFLAYLHPAARQLKKIIAQTKLEPVLTPFLQTLCESSLQADKVELL